MWFVVASLCWSSLWIHPNKCIMKNGNRSSENHQGHARIPEKRLIAEELSAFQPHSSWTKGKKWKSPKQANWSFCFGLFFSLLSGTGTEPPRANYLINSPHTKSTTEIQTNMCTSPKKNSQKSQQCQATQLPPKVHNSSNTKFKAMK